MTVDSGVGAGPVGVDAEDMEVVETVEDVEDAAVVAGVLAEVLDEARVLETALEVAIEADEEDAGEEDELEETAPPIRWYKLIAPAPPQSSVEFPLQAMLHMQTPLLPGLPRFGQD